MRLSATSDSLKRLRKVPWRFQQTFQTPLRNLQPFVAAIISAREQIQGATLTIDSIVFEPENLNALLSSRSLPPFLQRESSIEVSGYEEVGPLLQAALSDSVDFWFVPTPKPFVLFADHDEYTTFFAASKSNVNGVVEPLLHSCELVRLFDLLCHRVLVRGSNACSTAQDHTIRFGA